MLKYFKPNIYFLFISLIFFLFTALYSQPIIIPLGTNCSVAMILNHYQIRRAAYPFDWIITNHETTCKILLENFDQFLNPDHLVIDARGAPVVDTYYGIKFVHDFPYLVNDGKTQQIAPDFLSCWEEVHLKYQRRIERFRKTIENAISQEQQIIFIREGHINQREAVEIQTILKKLYPNLDFLLVIFTYNSFEKVDWNLPGIINQYTNYENLTTSEYLNREEWKKILIQLNLIQDK